MMLLKTENGIEHGLLGTKVNNVFKKDRFKNQSPEQKADNEKKLVHDKEIVKARYVHYKNQKSGTRYVDWTAGAGEPYYCFRFIHDNVYSIPRGVIEVVNNPHRKRPTREGSLDKDGTPLQKDGQAERIDEFVPVGF